MAGDDTSSATDPGQRHPDRPAVPQAPLALYRRYRPASFAEVKGQDHVTEPLRQALRSGRVNHAYLFSGPRGCGKTSSARILARSLNCELGPTPDPCGKCASCVALAPTGPGSIDVIEIDAASHGGIDDARDLRERAFYSPVAARYKIYIIDEAHMVTGAGFNALLKLVEEPPPHLKFVFATTEPEKVIPTIRSRTHHYPFRLVPPAILRELLEEILAAEGVSYEPAVLPVVIRAGAGSVRDSLSVLDQLIAGADESGLRYDRAIALLGYTDDALLDEMAEAFARGDGAGVFLAIDHVVEAGHDPRRFAMDLLDRLRDLIVLAAVPGAATSGLLDAPEDQLDRMRKQAAGFGQERLARAAETISAGLVEMRGATSPRLLLELMCAQVLLPAVPAVAEQATAGPAVTDDLAARVERIERRLAAGNAQAAGQDPGRRPASAQQRETGGTPPGVAAARGRAAQPEQGQGPRQGAASPPASGRAETSDGGGQRTTGRATTSPDTTGRATTGPGTAGQSATDQGAAGVSGQAQDTSGGRTSLDTEVLRSRWPEVLEAVRDVRKTAWILLSNYATVGAVDGGVLTMAFDTEGNAKGFASSGSDGHLADVLHSMFGVRLVIRAAVQPADGRGVARPGQGAGGYEPAGPGPTTRSGQGQGQGTGQAGASSDPGDADRVRQPSGPVAANSATASSRTASSGPASSGPASSGPVGSGPAGSGPAGSGTASSTARNSGTAQNSGTARSSGGRPAAGAKSPAGGRAAGKPYRGQPGESDIHDDPRPLTDPAPAGAGDEITGTDLIMRELGGRMIDEISER
jgi:DNA polymerase-3 subunit gamma/tau